MVKRDKKGRVVKGSVMNPNGRYGYAESKILAEVNQKAFIQKYFELINLSSDEINNRVKDPNTTAYERVAISFISNAIKGNDINYLRAFLKMIGIDISSSDVNVNMFDRNKKDKPEEKEVLSGLSNENKLKVLKAAIKVVELKGVQEIDAEFESIENES